MKTFVCKICGEVYLGQSIPPSCPFCGVNQKYLQLAHVWNEQNDIQLSEISKNNLKKALELELSNASFYKAASNTLSNQELALVFKGLYKVEKEHAEVFEKLLKPDKLPEIIESSEDDNAKCIEESKKREEKAIKFYHQALKEAEEERVKEVFEAIMNTEKDHLELDDSLLKKFIN